MARRRLKDRRPDAGEKRSVRQRSRVMLGATMISRGFSIEIRIRNLSRAGAMIEGEIVPAAGSIVELLRNDHSVPARVIWSKPGRCGVKFGRPISIEDWASPENQPPPVSFRDADRRWGGSPPSWCNAASPAQGLEERLPARVGEELAYIQRLIESVERDISCNPFIAARHGSSVHSCRLATGMLSNLARVLLAEDRVEAAERVEVPELKKRLLRK